MIFRAMGAGFLLWLAGTLLFRFAGPFFFTPDERLLLFVFIAIVPVMVVITLGLLRLIGEAPGDEAEAAIGLAAPGMLLDVYATIQFPTVFPNLDPLLGDRFGALMLLGYAAVLLTGLAVTRLAPVDERVLKARTEEDEPPQ